ncbi:uncharacterized protein LOC103869233 isoform X1 [Brassica rapa]|uniref:uncharacterized protein LOC103869233 isoform X1 n=2 Tax=Brassica campestris TaxID=3711 RepID=UPI0004F193BB|nr:uncharacterized protein LOC103869233 isoform X1 [Brassica rapa]
MPKSCSLLLRMASNDDLEFSFEANSFLDSLETFNAVTQHQENPSLLAFQHEHREMVPYVHVSAATNDVYPPSLIENPNTDQETLTRNPSFDQERVTQNQSFRHVDDYSRSINALQLSPNVPLCTFPNGQRESVYSGNCLLTSANNAMMSTGLQSVGSQHGYVNQSYQQPLMSQTNHHLFNDPYVSQMMESNAQQVERANGLTNSNPIYGLRDHRVPPFGCSFQGERHNLDSIVEQLKHIPGNDQMQQPETSNRHIPPYVEALQSNQLQIPYVSSANTIPNPEYRTPMISNNQVLQTPENYPTFAQTPYQPDPLAFNFQNSSSVKTTRRARGRPRKNQIPLPLVPTTQTILTSPRHYGTQDKGKQPITARPPLNPSLYDQCQNSYTNTMIQQSGVMRQRSIYDHQLENECSSFKTRRIMVPFKEKSIADSSTASFWQDGNLRSSSAAGSNHEERPIKNTMYDPLYAGVGLPIDPHLRLF